MEDIIGKIPFELKTFIRVICPALILMLFLYLRHGVELSIYFTNEIFFLIFILGITALSFLFFAIYRYVLYYPIIRYIELRTIGIPQYRFHLSIAKELNAPAEAKTMGICHATYPNIIAKSEKRDYFFVVNSFVHLIFMCAILSLIFFMHDIVFLGFQLQWISWLVGFFFLFIAGLIADNQSDERETAVLRDHKEDYKNNIKNVYSNSTLSDKTKSGLTDTQNGCR